MSKTTVKPRFYIVVGTT